MALNVKPLGDRILVEPVEEKETKKGGIIIPDTAKEKPMESIIVLVSKYGGTEIKLDGKEYKILSSDDLLAVID